MERTLRQSLNLTLPRRPYGHARPPASSMTKIVHRIISAIAGTAGIGVTHEGRSVRYRSSALEAPSHGPAMGF
jgi:hypothetical protein